MAITAKCDVFAGPVDVQPAAGEIWLITSMAMPEAPSAQQVPKVGLWDGVDLSYLFSSSSNTTISGSGIDWAGQTTAAHWRGHQSMKVVLTNTVRLRFVGTYTFGYTGVLLS